MTKPEREDTDEVSFKMDEPLSGFVDGKFTPDNWNDIALNEIRYNLDLNDRGGVMWNGTRIENVDVGNFPVDDPKPGIFFASKVATALGEGITLCGTCIDQRYALIFPEDKGKWFYVSWYKSRGQTEALYYAQEKDGVFGLRDPVSYKDAVFLGHFLDSIQKHAPIRGVKLTRIHTHEE